MTEETPIRVYCAGPLFNEAEREEMAKIADGVRDEGGKPFLPHEDGFEEEKLEEALSELLSDHDADPSRMAFMAIACVDLYEVCASHALVLNMNGRVPDEGAVSEAAVAATLGKTVVGYKDDCRTLMPQGDNPLVSVLYDFDEIFNVPARAGRAAVDWTRAYRDDSHRRWDLSWRPYGRNIRERALLGAHLQELRYEGLPLEDIAEVLRMAHGFYRTEGTYRHFDEKLAKNGFSTLNDPFYVDENVLQSLRCGANQHVSVRVPSREKIVEMLESYVEIGEKLGYVEESSSQGEE